MKRHLLTALALGTCCATLPLALTACDGKGSDATTQQAEAPKVKTFPIQQREVTDYGEWFGYLKGQKDTDIRPRVTGFLVSQDYKDGTYVKEGDVLFRIDPALFEAELARAQGNLKAAEANLSSAEASRDKAQLDVRRYEKLVRSSAVSEKDLADARQNLKAAIAAVDAAKASINQSEAAVAQAQINLDYTVVHAPYDGIIGTAQASQGELVGPSSRLANITSADPMRVDFSINSDMLIPALRNHSKPAADGSLHFDSPPFEIVTEDGNTYPLKGTIKAMESKVADSGLIDLEGEIPNPERKLRGGMPVRVRVPLNTHEALLVPQAAIRTVLRNSFIIIVDKQHLPHMLPVTVQGSYDIPVTEQDGYHSTQKFVAVGSYNHASLADSFRRYGYEKATEVPVVADADNGVRAQNISSANSRLAEGQTPEPLSTEMLSFRPQLNPALQKAADKATAQQKQQENSNAKPTMPPFPVKVAPLLCQDVQIRDEWFGTLRGVEETDIRPHVSGFLHTQNFKDGSLVKKGDVLFTIDPAPYKAARDEAEANLQAARAAREQARARLDMSEQDLARYRKVNATSPGAVADKTVTDAATAVQTNRAALLKAEATISQLEAALQLAEINLGYTTITAPFDGRVGIRKASIGDLVSPQDKNPLVTLSSVDPMRVDFNINAKLALTGLSKISELGTGQRKAANPGVDSFDVVLEDGSVYPEKGHIVSADNAISTTMGTLKVVGHVDNKSGFLRSGMPVRVRASIRTQRNAILVPVRAPLTANGMDLVVLLRPDNAPAMLPIVKGSVVYLPVTGPDGQSSVQPMQIVNFDRNMLASIALAITKAQSLEEAVLGAAGVKDWGELLLKRSECADFRALAEKMAGKPLPDAAAPNGDWAACVLGLAHAPDFRTLILREAHAEDEVDLIAQAKGFRTPAEMILQAQGITNMAEARVVVEGSLMAAQSFAKNQEAGNHANKLTPIPFQYSVPQTVVPSVTAEAAPVEATPPPPTEEEANTPAAPAEAEGERNNRN